MVYREGTSSDWPEITGLIALSEYFMPIYPPTLGGHWVVAEHDGRIVGCIWAFIGVPHAYIDYLYVLPAHRKSKVPARLILAMQHALKEAKVRYVRCNVLQENKEAARMVQALGVVVHENYLLGYKEI